MEYDFEMISEKEIIFKENGRELPKEILDQNSYKFYVDSATLKNGPKINLIPLHYYRLMTTITLPKYDENKWKTEFAPFVGSTINDSLFQFQKETVFRMVVMRRVMNACSPGLGKSIQALAAITTLRGKRTVILCPAYLRSNWENECRKWLPEDLRRSVSVIWKAGKHDIDKIGRVLFFPKEATISIISYDMLASVLSRVKINPQHKVFDTIVCDESHFLKDTKTKRYQTLAVTVKRSKNVFLLTGTPSPNRVKELYSQLSLIYPQSFFDYQTFAFRYCGAYKDVWGHLDDRGATNVRELAFILSKCMLRLRREDYLDTLPKVLRDSLRVKGKGSVTKFKAMRKEFVKELGNFETNPSAKFKVQQLASKMFRETCALKVNSVLEYLEHEDFGNEKVILFCKHKAMFHPVKKLLERMNRDHIAINGEIQVQERPELIERFLSDNECNWALLTFGVASTGLNLIPVSRMVFLELDWSPSTLDQCECRINRIGGAQNLHYTYLICDDSLDDMVFSKVQRKTELAKTVIDQGKEYGDFTFTSQKRLKTVTADLKMSI